MQPKTPAALPGLRIGLLGGSFNPPHDGHRHISAAAIARLGLDRVWWIVTPGNPLKATSELASLSDRIAAARDVAAHPRIDVTGFEAALGSAYTAETLAFLKRRFPAVRFVWIMGGDNLAQIDRWRAWRGIFHLMPIAVMDRPGARLKALASIAARSFGAARLPEEAASLLPFLTPPAWTYLSIPLRSESSSMLRRFGNSDG